jgi:hypothetical protein
MIHRPFFFAIGHSVSSSSGSLSIAPDLSQASSTFVLCYWPLPSSSEPLCCSLPVNRLKPTPFQLCLQPLPKTDYSSSSTCAIYGISKTWNLFFGSKTLLALAASNIPEKSLRCVALGSGMMQPQYSEPLPEREEPSHARLSWRPRTFFTRKLLTRSVLAEPLRAAPYFKCPLAIKFSATSCAFRALAL